MKKRATKSPLTREQVMGQMKQNAVFQKRVKFMKEEFWPLLCETAESIEDASTFLSGLNTVLMQSFLERMKTVKFAELKLDEEIAGDFDNYKPLLHLFDDMDVFSAKDHIEGMKGEIALFLADEQRKRPLKDLKATWIDDIAK